MITLTYRQTSLAECLKGNLIGGVPGVMIGLLVVTHPVAGALVWTLLFTSFLMLIGLFRLIAAISLKFPTWGWAFSIA
jgi:uncharacterized membrane protein HdeD (DUF308 family)